MIKLQKAKILDENIPFFEAIGLVVRINERKMTLAQLRREASMGLICLIKDKLGWISAPDEGSKIEITDKAKEHIIEYHAMVVLRNIKDRMDVRNKERGLSKAKLETSIPKKTIDFLKKKELIIFKDMGKKDDQVVHATEKGKRELEEYFKKEE